MDKKITTVAGISFALAFVAVFLIVWSTSQSIVHKEVQEMNSLYAADAPFDTSLFDNKVVTGQSIMNMASDMAMTSYTNSIRLFWYDYSAATDTYTLIGGDKSAYVDYTGLVSGALRGSIVANKEYRTFLHYNDNGIVDGIAIQR